MAAAPCSAPHATCPARLLPAPQAIAIAKRPHVIVGTPGRVVDHLTNTKGFNLKGLRHLVLDEADKLLDMDFEEEIDQILKVWWGWWGWWVVLGSAVMLVVGGGWRGGGGLVATS
jgi:hypothetical protein